MPVSRRSAAPGGSPRGRLSIRPGPLWLALLLAAPALAAAQSAAQRAADPATAVQPAPRAALPGTSASAAVELPSDIEQARAIWQRANARVAEFPRGHADLLRWESSQAGAAPAPAATQPRAGEALGLTQALRQSLRHRPDLFLRAGMNERERATVQGAYLAHARTVQRAWIDAVAARQQLSLASETHEAARTGAELGRRMVQAGNWSQARLMREQLVETSARQAWAAAQLARAQADERLAGLLGHWNAQAATTALAALPAELPALPAQLSPGNGLAPAEVEAAVLRSHPTLAWQRLEAERRRVALGGDRLAAWNRAVDGALDKTSSAWAAPEISDLRLLNDHALERAVEAEAGLLALASERRAMARNAWGQLEARYAAARLAQDELVQLQTALGQETVLRYNGMLLSTWDLLAQARERMGALGEAVQARRDFWLAQTDWQALLAGGDFELSGSAAGPRSGAAGATPGH